MKLPVLLLVLGTALSGNGQVVREWTHRSTATRNPGEASAAAGLGADYMVVAENENEVLRLYRRFPTNDCAPPEYEFNARPFLGLPGKREVDIEAAVLAVRGETRRIYWLGSHSNSKGGKLRPDRYRLFATDVSGTGAGSPPYSLGYVGRYDHLRTDLLVWDGNNLHGRGSNCFGLQAGAVAGVAAESSGGFNLEGLCLAPDGVTAWLAFRAPLLGADGSAASARIRALIIPLLNLDELVAGNPVVGPGKARFGTPFTLDLGGRGIRSIDSNFPGHYLIVAGPAGNHGDFRLFTWTGNPADAPVERLTDLPGGYAPEAALMPPVLLTNGAVVQLISDDSGACWRSFTVRVGRAK